MYNGQFHLFQLFHYIIFNKKYGKKINFNTDYCNLMLSEISRKGRKLKIAPNNV